MVMIMVLVMVMMAMAMTTAMVLVMVVAMAMPCRSDHLVVHASVANGAVGHARGARACNDPGWHMNATFGFGQHIPPV